MAKEEAIKHIENIKPYVGKNIEDALDMAIKALEQEPILDKIRAEIVDLTNGDTPERIWNVDALQIIDKYKAELEKL